MTEEETTIDTNETETTTTETPIDPNTITVDIDETYRFTISAKTTPNYKMAATISNWLIENLSNLTDDNNHKIFGKVNLGFNEDTIRTFGSKPVCDIYIDNIEYNTDFDTTRPVRVNTIVLFYMKGTKSATYRQACNLHDYIMQSFITDEDWQILNGYVSETFITGSRVMNQQIRQQWGVMGAFTLTHTLY